MSIKYRSEIDGLRAIAVLLVIFNHLGISYFSGGFVGVDVFFVISGFLITSIIKKEIENNAFTFGNFYKKRVIRLAPAYFLVLTITTLLMAYLSTPNDFQNYIKSTLYSSVFAANFYMWKNIGGYFSVNAELTPLLHLWSLGIEEQFYIIWPIVLIVLTKYMSKARLPLIIFVILISVILSQKIATVIPDMAYFLLPFRAFELLIGAALAFIPFRNNNKILSSTLSFIGLSLILVPAFIFSKLTVFPGLNALIPCLGTALVIYFCRDGIFQKALSTWPMVFVGKISYPAYLWHWPLIVFLNIYYVEINFFVGTLTLTSTLILAWLTYNYVEKRFSRYSNSKTSRVIIKGYTKPLLLTLTVGLVVINQNGFPERFDEKILKKDVALSAKPNEIRAACIDGGAKNLPNPENCKLGVDKKEIDFLLIGDSHANHFAPMIDVFAKDAKIRGYDITQQSTLFLPNLDRYNVKGENKILVDRFKSRNDELIKHLNTHKYKYVILAGSYADSYTASIFKGKNLNESSEKTFYKGVKDSIELIQSNGAKPILVVGSPRLTNYDHTCPLKKDLYNLSINCNTSKAEHISHFKKWRKVIDILKIEYPNLTIIDPTLVMCSNKECFAELDGIPLYKDRGHLNYIGSTLIGELYLKRFNNPFKMI